MRLGDDRIWIRLYALLAAVFLVLGTATAVELVSDPSQRTIAAKPGSAGQLQTNQGSPTDPGARLAGPAAAATNSSASRGPVVRQATDKAGISLDRGVLKIGSVVPLQLGPYGDPMLKAMQAFVRKKNAEGGVNGLRLELVVYDGGLDQQGALAAVKRLVEVDKVFALVGGWTPVVSDTTYPYLEKQGVPWVGNDAFMPSEFNSPIGFNTHASQIDTGPAEVKFMFFEQKCKRQALITLNLESTLIAREEALKTAKLLGAEIVADEITESTDNDFTPLVLRLRSANPDCIVALESAVGAVKLHQAMQRQNWKVPLVGTTGMAERNVQAEIDNNWLDGVWNVRLTEPENSSSPAVKEYLATLKKFYGDRARSFNGPWPMTCYVALQVFSDVVGRIQPERLSRSVLMQELNKMTDHRTGLTYPLNFRPGQHHLNRYVGFVRFDKATQAWLGDGRYWDGAANKNTVTDKRA